jgi:hypothetical protein
MEEQDFFYAIKIFTFWMSPVIFLEGLLLLLSADKYNKLERILKKEIGGIRKKAKSKLETERYAFHEWLLKRKYIVSFSCIIYSALVFFRLLEKLYRKF